jgi:hypothetical protein
MAGPLSESVADRTSEPVPRLDEIVLRLGVAVGSRSEPFRSDAAQHATQYASGALG